MNKMDKNVVKKTAEAGGPERTKQVTPDKTPGVGRQPKTVEQPATSDSYRSAARVSQLVADRQQQMMGQLVLRYPGTTVVIHDRRAEFAGRRGGHERPEGHGRHDEKQGRGADRAEGHGRHAGPGTGVESGLATVKKTHGMVGATEEELAIKAARFEGKERPLSAFEKFLVGRFEKGEQQAMESRDGQFYFLKKTAAEWKGFFENFLSRTIQKVVGWSDVQGFLFRGLLQEKGMSQKGVMISDVMTAAGVDKFARIPVLLGRAHQLAAAMPGAMVSREVMQSVVGEQLRYLALGTPQGEEGGVQFGRAASRGMFSSQQLESRVAEHLGLVTDFRGAGMPGIAQDAEEKRTAEGRRRRGGLWSRLFGGDDVEGEGSVFVPWWSWNREERTGFRRWFVAVFGAVIFVVLFFLLIALIHALRP